MDNNTLACIEPDAVEVIERPDYAAMTLDELATCANEQHRAFRDAEQAVFHHLATGLMRFMDVGDALNAAEAKVPQGQWERWIAANCEFGPGMARKCKQTARNRVSIEEWIANGGEGGSFSLQLALKHVKGLGPAASTMLLHGDEVKAEARRLHRDGTSITEIAETLDVTWVSVKRWVDPAYDREQRAKRKRESKERRDARKALREKREREARDRLARSTGGEAEKAYEYVRKTTNALMRAQEDAPRSAREHLHAAERLALRAEEALMKAMNEMRTL